MTHAERLWAAYDRLWRAYYVRGLGLRVWVFMERVHTRARECEEALLKEDWSCPV